MFITALFPILSTIGIIASAEMDMIWLIIGFFVFVALMAAVAIYVLLRQNRFSPPTKFLQAAMMILLFKTMLLSLIIAVGLFRASG